VAAKNKVIKTYNNRAFKNNLELYGVLDGTQDCRWQQYIKIGSWFIPKDIKLVLQASSPDGLLQEYEDFNCLSTIVINFCVKAMAAPWSHTRFLLHGAHVAKITVDRCYNYLPKGVATVNQFISSSLKSAFHSLTKSHPTLNGEDVSNNTKWYCNKNKCCISQTHKYRLLVMHFHQRT